MKQIFIVVLTNILLINHCSGQGENAGDFLEVGIKTSRFIESSFLENSAYSNQLSDPSVDSEGLIASPTGKNYAAKFRFGSDLSRGTYLIAELGFTKRNEQVSYFCHSCDFIGRPATLVEIYTTEFGIGIRKQLFDFRNFNLSVEGVGSYSISFNEYDLDFFGYSIHPIVQYDINEHLGVNFRYGFEQSFFEYEKRENYAELAMNYKLNDNTHGDGK